MKKMYIGCLLTFFFSSFAYAQLKVISQGDDVSIDTSGFPSQMQMAYKLMAQKCSQCHTIDRVIAAVQTGVTPLSRGTFTKETTRALVRRMYLKPGSNLTKKDAREIVLLLNFMLDVNMKVSERKE